MDQALLWLLTVPLVQILPGDPPSPWHQSFPKGPWSRGVRHALLTQPDLMDQWLRRTRLHLVDR